jgi:sulfur-oxidizing protein SoxZ
VLEAQWSQAVSKNPFLNFRVRGAKPGDKIMVGWVDNRGDKASIEATLD